MWYSEEDAKPESAGGFNAVPFSYGNDGDSNNQKAAEIEQEVPKFYPPFPVPDSLVQNLVSSNKSAFWTWCFDIIVYLVTAT